eukprot:1963684-Rhodomonas_salina.2
MGRGGMASTIEAAQTAAGGGVSAIVANGSDMNNMERIFSGGDVGPLFPATARPSMVQNWLAQAAQPARDEQGDGDGEAAAEPGG